LNFTATIPLYFVVVQQMAAVGQSDRMMPDTAAQMKQKCVIAFLHAEKIISIRIHQCLLKIYGDQTVDVSTVSRWVVRFSCGDINSVSPPLVQNFTSTACRLLFIPGKNA